MSWDRSPSSPTKTTPRLSSVAASMGDDLSTRRRRPLGHRTPVEGLAHRPGAPVRRPGCAPVCRLDDSGLLPFANGPRLAGGFCQRQEGTQVRAPAFLDSNAELIRLNSLMLQAALPGSPCRDG